MKFEYDGNSDERKCVAYIDKDGDLVLKMGGGVYFISKMYEACGSLEGWEWFPEKAEHKFYPGDKITITF